MGSIREINKILPQLIICTVLALSNFVERCNNEKLMTSTSHGKYQLISSYPFILHIHIPF